MLDQIQKRSIFFLNNKKIIVIWIMISLLFLTGCKSTIMVYGTSTDEVIPVFKDYVNIHGYNIAYANDQNGSYRIFLGSYYVPQVIKTELTKVKTKEDPAKNLDQTIASYEHTTVETTNEPGHQVYSNAMVRIVQQEDDVRIIIETPDMINYSHDNLTDYLKDYGFIAQKL